MEWYGMGWDGKGVYFGELIGWCLMWLGWENGESDIMQQCFSNALSNYS